MDHLEEYVRNLTGRIERLETESDRLSRELTRAVESRQAEQDQVRRELASALDQVNLRMGEVAEIRAQIESLSNALRGTQVADRELGARQDEAFRRLESTSARIDGLDGRLSESRRLTEQIGQELAVVRGEVGRVVETLYSLRESQQQHAQQTQSEIAVLREAASEPHHRLDRLEEIRRSDVGSMEKVMSSIAQLSAVDSALRASLEKLTRVVAEEDTRIANALAAVSAEAAASVATLRQISEERVARQQDELRSVLNLATDAQSTAQNVQDSVSRLRHQMETAIHEILSTERRRLERAAEFAVQEFKAYDERVRSDTKNGQIR